MAERRVVIIGGGVAGLSAGCYARASGMSTHVVEHGLALGGVCTSWQRDPYLVDGCLHWLMGGGEGGWFRRVYEELGLLRALELQPIDVLTRVEDAAHGWQVSFGRDPESLRAELRELAPEDREAIDDLVASIYGLTEMPGPLATEEATLTERLKLLWDLRGLGTAMLRFRGSVAEWGKRHLHSRHARAALEGLLAPEMPALLAPVLLSQLATGQLARVTGGSAALRDALAERYHSLGGEVTLNATVDEIVVDGGRARGVRLEDGTIVDADTVISTSSLHETMLRLLGGRFIDREMRKRLEHWPLFRPVAMVSAGVADPLEDDPPVAIRMRQSEPLQVGDRDDEWVLIRIMNQPPFAPPGHAVAQTLLPTSYDWWAQRGDRYGAEKHALGNAAVERFARRYPAIAENVEMLDVSTPLTFWRHARSWRGAYEGWMPTPETFQAHVPCRVTGLEGLFLAGQWLHPGGGIPPSLLSGRQAVRALCEHTGSRFRAA